MKLNDTTLIDINEKSTKEERVLAWHIRRTENAEENIQIDLIMAGLEEDNKLGILDNKQYLKTKEMLAYEIMICEQNN